MRDLSELPAFLEVLNKKFIYRSDKEEYGTVEYWTVLDLEAEFVHGDCEDYSLTIQKEFGGRIHICKYDGVCHAILKLPDGTWIDNIQKKPVKELNERYTMVIPLYNFLVKLEFKLSKFLRILKI